MKQNRSTPGSLIMGVAFVWFTTHFGGGFASGAQLYSYYLRFGLWCLLMPVLAMAYNAFFFSYCLRYARKHEVYDYRSYNNHFYGRFAPVFSNLFEFLYIVVMCVAPAVAFATGDLVRRVSSVLSIVIIVSLVAVYVPNIIVNADGIRASVAAMQAAPVPFGKALYSAFLYGTFQLCNVAVFVQHGQVFEKPGDAKKSMLIGWVINSALMLVVVLGLLTVYAKPEMTEQSVPTLFMVQQGVGASVLTPLISILIILGAVTTAVNMVAAMVRRIGNAIETDEEKALTDQGKPVLKTIVIALVCCLADFGIAQFGLLTLIQRAYSTIAYLAIPVILIPYIVHMIVTRFDTK